MREEAATESRQEPSRGLALAKRLAPVALLGLAAALIFGLGLHKYLTFEALREHTRKRRFVRQLFLIADEGPFLYPDPTGSLTDRESEFFIRTRSIWNLGERLDGSGDR